MSEDGIDAPETSAGKNRGGVLPPSPCARAPIGPALNKALTASKSASVHFVRKSIFGFLQIRQADAFDCSSILSTIDTQV